MYDMTITVVCDRAVLFCVCVAKDLIQRHDPLMTHMSKDMSTHTHTCTTSLERREELSVLTCTAYCIWSVRVVCVCGHVLTTSLERREELSVLACTAYCIWSVV